MSSTGRRCRPADTRPSGKWLVVVAAGTTDEVSAVALDGAQVVRLTVDGADRVELAQRLRDLETDFTGVLSLLAEDRRPDPNTPCCGSA